MNSRHICVFDLETGSPDHKSCQIIQIAAQTLHARKLTIMDEFSSWVKPDFNASGVTKETLDWHAGLRKEPTEVFIERLNQAPDIKTVWPRFIEWVDRYNLSTHNKTGYDAPIAAGYNINGFDIPIINRYCLEYGPTQKNKRSQSEEPRLFNPIYTFDLLQHMWFWTENISDTEVANGLKLNENVKTWMGFPKERLECAHDALEDVRDTSIIIQKLFNAQRYLTAIKPDCPEGKRRLHMKGCYNNK